MQTEGPATHFDTFVEAIAEAFGQSDLERFFFVWYGKSLSDEIDQGSTKKAVIFNLLTWVTQRGLESEFVRAITRARPDKQPLKQAADQFLQSSPASPGKVRSNGHPIPGHVGKARFVGRSSELGQLNEAFRRNENLVYVHGLLGSGTSALVAHWLEDIFAGMEPSLERVYVWSFQGPDSQRSEVAFLDDALKWFSAEKGGPAQIDDLRDLINASKTVLVLDGLDAVWRKGRDPHPILMKLLRWLGQHMNGLLVVTGTCPPDALQGLAISRLIHVEKFSDKESVELLKKLCPQHKRADLQRVAKALGGHALSLTHMGLVLAAQPNRPGIDILDKSQNEFLNARSTGSAISGNPTSRFLAWYRAVLTDVQLALLRVLALQFAAIDTDLLVEVCHKNIPRVTGPLKKRSQEHLLQVTEKLANLDLVLRSKDEPTRYALHPAVHLALKHDLEKKPSTWSIGQKVLFELFEQQAPDRPKTLTEVAVCQAAVWHACKAGDLEQAKSLYEKKLMSGEEGYSFRHFGKFEAELDVLRSFFSHPWEKLVSGLSLTSQAYIFVTSGYALRGSGQLRNALKPLLEGFLLSRRVGDHKLASSTANNLSRTYQALGQLKQGLKWAQTAETEAKECPDQNVAAARLGLARVQMADVWANLGNREEAIKAFVQAEAIHSTTAEVHALNPLLPGIRGFLYGMFLLEEGGLDTPPDLLERAMAITEESKDVLDEALSVLLQGYCRWKERVPGDINRNQEVETLFTKAIRSLIDSGRRDFLPYGYLARSAYYRSSAKLELARNDLERARVIAEEVELKLVQVDILMEEVRIELADDTQENSERIDTLLSDIEDRIGALGYLRREKKLEELRNLLHNRTPFGESSS